MSVVFEKSQSEMDILGENGFNNKILLLRNNEFIVLLPNNQLYKSLDECLLCIRDPWDWSMNL